MTAQTPRPSFKVGLFLLLLLPYGLLHLLDSAGEMPAAIAAMALAIVSLCTLIHFVRHRRVILEGMLASLVLVGLCMACAMIPVIGWIFDAFLLLYAMANVLEAVGALMPLAMKALLMWAFFALTLLPAFHHPIYSPIAYVIFCLAVTSVFSKKNEPYGALVLLMASIPLLGMIIISLGKMFQSNVTMGRGGIKQHVAGYARSNGVQVGSYTRTVTGNVTTVTTSVNAAPALTTLAATHAQQDEAS